MHSLSHGRRRGVHYMYILLLALSLVDVFNLSPKLLNHLTRLLYSASPKVSSTLVSSLCTNITTLTLKSCNYAYTIPIWTRVGSKHAL
jgi:hypothetical protein